MIWAQEDKFVVIGTIILFFLLLVVLIFAVQKLKPSSGSFGESQQSEEADEQNNKKNKSSEESEEAKELEIDIDGTNSDGKILGTFTYEGNGEGSIDLDKRLNIYAENEEGDKELLEGVENVSLLLEQVDDMVESQWIAGNGYEVEVEGKVCISEGEVYVQVNEFEVVEEYYDITEDGINSYSFHVEDCTWLEAQQRAKERGGILAHINSREEYEYLLSEISSRGYTKIQFKIGGRRDVNSQDYYWVDENNETYGEIINSSTYWCNGEWLAGEPSYKDGSIEETYLQIFWRESQGAWYWNDVPNDVISVISTLSGKIGYIVEYED